MRLLKTVLLWLTGCAVISSHGASAENDPALWRIGFGRADVTPERPVWMSGYGSRDRPSEGVECEIFVKDMVLEDDRGERAVLVTSDFAGMWRFFSDPVVDEVAEDIGVERERFLFTCTHNHSGPTISLNDQARGEMNQQQAENTVRYTRAAQQKLIEAIRAAAADLAPARLSWGVGVW